MDTYAHPFHNSYLFMLLLDAVDAQTDATHCFFTAKQFGDIKHVRTLALAHHSQAERIHHIAQMVTLIGNPTEHHRFSGGRREIIKPLKHAYQFGQYAWHFRTPTLAHSLFVVRLRLYEEKSAPKDRSQN